MYGELLPVGGGDPIPLLKKSPAGGAAGELRHRLAVLQRLGPSLPVDRQRRVLARPRPAKPQRGEGQRRARHGEAARSGRYPFGGQAQVRGEVFAGGPGGRGAAAARGRRGRRLRQIAAGAGRAAAAAADHEGAGRLPADDDEPKRYDLDQRRAGPNQAEPDRSDGQRAKDPRRVPQEPQRPCPPHRLDPPVRRAWFPGGGPAAVASGSAARAT